MCAFISPFLPPSRPPFVLLLLLLFPFLWRLYGMLTAGVGVGGVVEEGGVGYSCCSCGRFIVSAVLAERGGGDGVGVGVSYPFASLLAFLALLSLSFSCLSLA